MADDLESLLGWPALTTPTRFPEEIRATPAFLLGSMENDLEPRWLIRGEGFEGDPHEIEAQINPVAGHLGPSHLWRTDGEVHYAVSSSPGSGAAEGEDQARPVRTILRWTRSPETPAALGALLLTTYATRDPGGLWRTALDEEQKPDDAPPSALPAVTVPVTAEDLLRVVEDGLDELAAALDEKKLAKLYEGILTGRTAMPVMKDNQLLSAEAMASLLLPLPREIADHASLAAMRLKGTSSPADLQGEWNAVLGAEKVSSVPARPTGAQRRQAKLMAKAVLERDPSFFGGSSPAVERPAPAARRDPRTTSLALWGPASAGKTMLLAQLYLQTLEETTEKWSLLPREESTKEFLNSARRMITERNSFVRATPIKRPTEVVYQIRNDQTGVEADLHVEDRAGGELTELSDDVKESLLSADGFIILLDAAQEANRLEIELAELLEGLHLRAGSDRTQKDARPTAVCLSKADVLLRTAEDVKEAVEEPDRFVRRRIPASVVNYLERYLQDFQLFPISAAGVRVSHGVVDHVVFFDETFTPRLEPGGTPINLISPFSWLLDKLARNP